jgi:4-aminobutyrate aminotransferase/(S)-3-amino-2-methylpropionate transaminase
VSCRAALAVFEIFETENLLERSKQLGRTLRQRFDAFKDRFAVIGDVRGLGPMMALELVKDKMTKEPAADEAKNLVKYCYDHGLILLSCGSHGNVIRTLMPLVIGEEELEQGLSIMEAGLQHLS